MEKEKLTYTEIAQKIAAMRKRRGIVVSEKNYHPNQKAYEALHKTVG